MRKETTAVISKKRNFKLLRLVICLAVAMAVSSMLLTVEPMASENANPQVMAAVQEDEVVEIQILRAYSSGIPVTPLRIALQPLNATQDADADTVQAALQTLSKTEGAGSEAAVETSDETVYEEVCDVICEEEPEESYEESKSVEETTPYEPEAEENSSAPAESEVVAEKETEEESLPEASAPGSYSDLEYLAAICQIEAGYNYEGCLAVANVILNRVNAGFGSSIYDVIYAPYQFATGWMDYYLENGTSSEAYEAAAAALAGSNNIGGYLYFNGTTWLNPETLDCPYVVIGGNVFY